MEEQQKFRERIMEEQQGQLHSQPPVKITVRENASYLVEGPVTIVDADGTEYDISAKKRVSLCRCGASTNKPFCDGTHSKLGFAAAERAVRQAEGGA